MKLSSESYLRAREFLRQHARPIERARYCYHFGCTPAVDARVALAAYQNQDGGFGRALEPDCRLPDSSVLATTVAFQLMREMGVPPADRLVKAAVRWTQAAFERTLDRWPLIPPEVDGWPHAPWWTWSPPGHRGFTVNPGAELVAHLWHYHEVADATFLAYVTDLAESLVTALPARIELHDLLSLVRLAETPAVPAVLRNKAADRARAAAPALVVRDPQAWSTYAAAPLLLAPRADSLLTPVLGTATASHLDYEIAHQAPDGSWGPNWDWAGAFPHDWRQAERDWRSVRTLHLLLKPPY